MNQRKKNNPSRIHSWKETITQSQAVESVINVWHSLPRLHQRILMVLLPLLLIVLLWPTSDPQPQESAVEVAQEPAKPSRMTVPLIINGEETAATKPKPKVEKNEQRVQLGGPNAEPEEPVRKVSNNAGPEPWNDYTVQKGDTLSQVFRNNDLPLSDLTQLLEVQGKDKPLSHIKAGQLVRFKLTNRGDLDILQIEKEDGPVMFFRLNSGGFSRSTQ